MCSLSSCYADTGGVARSQGHLPAWYCARPEEEPLRDSGIPGAAADPWLERCLTCLSHITSHLGGQGEPWAAPGRECWFPRGPP